MADVPSGFLSAHERLCAPLEGAARGMSGARRVFHAVLVNKLETDGALTERELTGRLGWFKLTLARAEVEQLVASAQRHGMIEPLDETEGGQIRWVPTDRGRALRRPSGASAEDLLSFSGRSLRSAQELFTTWWTAALGALAVLGIGEATDERLIAACAAVAIVILVMAAGVAGERDLRDAAASWPRLADKRPKRYQWQTLPGRAELVASLTTGLVAFLAAAWVVRADGWERLLLGLAAGVAALLALIYVVRLAPLSRAWREEAKLASKTRQRRRRLGRRLKGLGQVFSWLGRGSD